jgi:hypothetical protein
MTFGSLAMQTLQDHALLPGTDWPLVELCKLEASHAGMIKSWLDQGRASHWLDLGSGRQQMSTRELFLMLIGPRCHARLFRLPGAEEFLGLVCLTDCSNAMGSAEVWGMRGFYGPTPMNVVPSAFVSIAATGFLDLGREVIGSWVVEGNQFSIATLERLGMRQMGRQRARHRVNGRLQDRLLFDVVRAEFADRYPLVPAESGRTFASCGSAAFA